MSISMKPGAMQLAVIPWTAVSCAMHFVSAISPAVAAA
jgi:hypothetical protein